MDDILTPQEESAMLVLWEQGEGTVKKLLDAHHDSQLPYTTLASTLKNLQRKGFVKTRMIGKVYFYSPTITHTAFKKKFIRGVIKNYFHNSYKDVVTFFIEQKKISGEELKELIHLIENDGYAGK
jgi:BlaI family transcriptional regulator, penicillinase repressor